MKRLVFFSTYKEVIRLLPPRLKRKFAWLVLLVFFTSIIDLLGLAAFIPIISLISDPGLADTSRIFSSIRGLSGVTHFPSFILLLFGIAITLLVIRLFFVVFSQRLQAGFVFQLARYIGASTYSHFLSSSYEEFHKKELAQVVRELSLSPQHFAKFLVMPLLMVSSEMIVLLLVIGGIALYNIDVFLLLMVTVFPAAALFQWAVKGRLKKYGQDEHRYSPQLYTNSTRGSQGYIDVKLRNKEDKLLAEYNRIFSILNNISINTTTLNIIPAKLFELVTIAGLFVIALYGYVLVDKPSLVLPLITVYAAAGYRIIPSLSRIVPSLMQLEQFQYLFDVYRPVFNGKPIRRFSMPGPPLSFERKIELQQIGFCFSSGEKKLFESLSLTIQKGEVLGFVGKSGSGKTTLVNLIAGFYLPTEGAIMIDGERLTNELMSSWWKKISYVQQSSYIEKGTLASNIAFLDDDVNSAQLRKAIEGAFLNDLLNGKNATDFLVEENGKNLSGGQKQRLIIARALYHNSDLIILDEATSALDNETENAINETILHLRSTGITILIIAHRYSTLRYTDRIFVMGHGKILEETRYDQLTASH